MVYIDNGSVASLDIPFEAIIEDLVDGNFYKVSIDANNNIYSEVSTETTEKQFIMTDVSTNLVYRLVTENGEVRADIIDIDAITSSVDLTEVKAKLDQLIDCSCEDKDANTNLPFKMYGIE